MDTKEFLRYFLYILRKRLVTLFSYEILYLQKPISNIALSSNLRTSARSNFLGPTMVGPIINTVYRGGARKDSWGGGVRSRAAE